MVFPENTLIAVNGAIKLGADGIEVDVALTGDDVPIVMHDQSVNRTTNGTGSVRDLSLAQIRALDACSWKGAQWSSCQVPLAEEVIAAVRGHAYLILDLKGPWPPANLTRLLAMVRQHGMSDSTMITSFSPDQLALVRRIDGRVTLGWLQTTPIDPSAFLGLGHAAVLIEEGAIRNNSASMAAFDSLLAKRHSLLGAWTIYDPNRVAPLRSMGVRWYITDIPLDKAALGAP
jgi:glycerophosphoryl diester phosphodiesterase